MDNSTSFDPFSQSFTLLLPDGTPFHVSIPELDYFIAYSTKISIIYASALGASLLFVILLLLLTKADKRKSPIFIINAVALVINVIRDLLQCLYFTGPFSETYAYFAQDYSRVNTSDFANQFALAVLTVVVVVCVEASLMLQVRAVCITLRQLYQRLITAFSIVVASVAIAVRLALTIENCKYIISLAPPTPLQGLANAANITTSISICWFCAVFVIKLGFALNQKRKLGVARFGPMHVIFIMGCQTLIIPGKYFLESFFERERSANRLSVLLHPPIYCTAAYDEFERLLPRINFYAVILPLGFIISR